MDTDRSDLVNSSSPLKSPSGGLNQSYGSNLPKEVTTSTSRLIQMPTSPIVDFTGDPIDNTAVFSNTSSAPIRRMVHPNTSAGDDSDIYVADTSKDNLLPAEDEEDDNGDNAILNLTDESLYSRRNHDSAHDHPHNSLVRTFINMFKGNIGTGVLTIPDAIKNAGLFFGTFAFVLLGILATYCQHQLLHAYRQVSDGKPLGYARVVERVFRQAGGRFERHAKTARRVINYFLCLTQFGFCCVYILFCAKMVKEVVDSQMLEEKRLSIYVYEVGILAILLPYCCITTLKALSLFNLFGNFATAASIIIVMQYVCRNLQVVENVDWYPTDPLKLPLFFGTAMFTFESIGLILPIENRMENRDAFHHWNGLLSFSMACIVVLYCFVGFYGYLAFGSDARMILSNLPSDDWLYSSVKLLYALAVFLSYNLQLYVPIQIMFPTIRRKINKPWFDKFGEYLFRMILVIFTFALAIGIPCLEYMISLVGALASSGLALIFPPIVEVVSCLHKNHRHRLTAWCLIKNVIIVFIGLFGSVIGTSIAIKAIAEALMTPGGCSV